MNKAEKLIKVINSKIDFLEHFVNDGATTKEIDELEKEVGFELPKSLKRLLQIANGEGRIKLKILGLFFSSTHRIIHDLNFFKDSPVVEPEVGLYQEKMVKPDLYNVKRIPFATDESGIYLCVDFDPDENGTYGQVVYLPCAESEPVSVIADSFDDFLDFIIESYENGKIYLYDLRDDWDEDDWEEWRVDEGSDYSVLELYFDYKWSQDWTDVSDRYNNRKKQKN